MASVVIVGAGPAGALLATLLARGGAAVTLVERASDFEREFRGEVLMPSGLEALAAARLDERLASVSRRTIDRVEFHRGGEALFELGLVELLGPDALPVSVSQPDLLQTLVLDACDHPSFRFVPGASVGDLLRDGDRVRGVKARTSEGEEEFRADLVVGCDGRFSALRKASGLVPRGASQEFDVVWCKLPPPPARIGSSSLCFWLGQGRFAIGVPTHDRQYQLGWVIEKGTFRELRDAGPEARIARLAQQTSPEWSEYLGALPPEEIERPFLLDVVSNCLEAWSLPGLLLLGDAAHPMSPVGGQGLNLALRDALVAAGELGPLLAGEPTPEALDAAAIRVRDQRLPEVRRIQRLQARAPRALFSSGFASRWLVDRLAPFLVRVGLARLAFGRTFRRFAHGVGEVRYRVDRVA